MTFSKYYWTIKHLKLVQIWGRLWHNIYTPEPDYTSAPDIRQPLRGVWVKPPSKHHSLVGPSRFIFLNEEHEICCPEDWDNPSWEKLWKYNLHYFDFINSEQSEKQDGWQLSLMQRWVNENRAGVGVGWEPYTLSLRIVNWIKYMLSNSMVLPDELINSLAVQTRYLRKKLEVHLLGNHLWANAKALIFSGLFFGGEEANRWFRKGNKIFSKEIVEQVLNDGGHFELSPMYHAIMLEDLLDVINILQAYGLNVPDEWLMIAQKMYQWLLNVCHPDGDIVLFNDAAFGISSKPSSVGKYMMRLNIDVPQEDKGKLVHLKSSGYIRCRKGQAVAFLDVGPIGPDYLPAHAHADTLNFELSLAGKRMIVDSGTSCYRVSSERLRQRSTSAHNTVTINDRNSSEVWGAFRVARRARPVNIDITEVEKAITVFCGHDGYKRLPGSPVHYRKWIMEKEKLTIKDYIKGKFEKAISRFFFHPDILVTVDETGKAGRAVNSKGIFMNWSISERDSASLVSATYHPEFGRKLANQCLEITFNCAESMMCFSWEESEKDSCGDERRKCENY